MHFSRLLILSAFAGALPLSTVAQNVRTPVLVELFTSEGCSSCPPADALLAKLQQEQPVPSAEVIVLGEHVDYWDSLGWRDRFSSHRFTERQNLYGSHFGLPDVYTPQMVVAGRAQFNGADAGAAARAIVQAARTPGIPLAVSEVRIDGTHLIATLRSSGAGLDAAAELYAALVAPSETTVVRSGENGGRTLRHAGVVLGLTSVGDLHDLRTGPLTIRIDAPAGDQTRNLVVFAQTRGLGPVLGVTLVAVSGAGHATSASMKK